MGKKIGRTTAGVFFILLGIIWILNNWLDLSFVKVFSYLWPVLFISLGIEVIIAQKRNGEEEKIGFDKLAVTLLVSTILLSGALFSIGGLNSISFGFSSGIYKNSLDVHEVYAAEEVENILLEFTNSSITVLGKNTSDIIIEGVIKSNSDKKSLEKAYDSREVDLTSKEFKYIAKENSSFFSGNKNSVYELTITVPSELTDFELKVVNGSIDVQDIQGDLEVSSVNGKIEVAEIKGNVKADTSNGSINIKNVSEELKASSINGAIDATSDTLAGDWQIETVNGRIRIGLPANASVYIEAETQNGKVSGNPPWERKYAGELIKEGTQGSATINNGDFTVKAKGTNGAIQVDVRE